MSLSVGYIRETDLVDHSRIGERVGLLAGGGRFPFRFAEAARQRGIRVVCVAIRDHADPALCHVVDTLHWAGVARIGRVLRLFHRENVDCAVMAGKVEKTSFMYRPWRALRLLPDWHTIRFWLRRQRPDNRDDSLLLALIDDFARNGIRMASALEICPELLVKAGTLTKRKATAAQLRDVEFGWQIAKRMGDLDVGQSVAVRETSVVAVEAVEGTDRMIRRAGALCPRGGFALVKVAKPEQDMRFDVPTVGEQTVRTMHAAGGSVIAIEADKTILIDGPQTVALADELGIALVSLVAGKPESAAA